MHNSSGISTLSCAFDVPWFFTHGPENGFKHRPNIMQTSLTHHHRCIFIHIYIYLYYLRNIVSPENRILEIHSMKSKHVSSFSNCLSSGLNRRLLVSMFYLKLCKHVCMYIYIHIYIYIYT